MAEKNEADIIFDEMAEAVPEKGADLPDTDDDDEVEHQTLEQGMASPNLSDMAIADKRLFPKTGYDHLDMLMVSRVWPDSYNPLQSILVKDLLRHDPKLRLAEAIVLVSTPQSIAIDGEGRLDTLTALGSSAATEQKNDMKNLGGI